MSLEITLQIPIVLFRDREGKPIGSTVILDDFGALLVTATTKNAESKLVVYDAVNHPYTITHRDSGMIVNVFPSRDLAACAAREWSKFDWPKGIPDPKTHGALLLSLYKQMRATTIFQFSGRKGPA